MYRTMPLVAVASVNNVVGAATVAIVAAPGAGFALRIVGCHIGIGRTTGGVVEGDVQSTTTAVILAQALGLELAGTASFSVPIPEPGVQAPVNEGLTLQSLSTAATGRLGVIVYYFVDNMSA